jgi:AraC-like DNA-binding protein
LLFERKYDILNAKGGEAVFQEIKRMMDSFSEISGLKVSLIDGKYRGLVISGYQAGEYCALLHRTQNCLATCLQSNVEAFQYVSRTKAPYIYRCPFGFVEIVAPIVENEAVYGFLIAGPISEQPNGASELLFSQADQYGVCDDMEELSKAVESIRYYCDDHIRALCDMLMLLASYVAQSGEMRMAYKTVGQLAKDYIKRNLSRKILLSDLAVHIHCSTVTVTQHFRQEFGISVTEYILQKRMKLAVQLLSESNYTVGEIAARCGFCDSEYFSKSFRKTFGISPVEYRKQHEKS